MQRIIEQIVPISWSGWDPSSELNNVYYDVVIEEDFGVFKKGETYSSLSIDYGRGIIDAYSETGDEIVKRQYWKAQPISEI
jgi:hypothetical protein